MASVNQVRPHSVNQMGKTHSKPLAARHDRGTAWAQHRHDMLCVNRPLGIQTQGIAVTRNQLPGQYSRYFQLSNNVDILFLWYNVKMILQEVGW